MSNKPGFKHTQLGWLPEEWEIKRVGKITKTLAGGTPSTSVKDYWNGNIKWMNSGELNLKKVYNVEGRITEIGLRNSSARLIPPGSILIGLAGQGKTRGTVAMNMIELCTNQSVAAILPTETFVGEYLYYNLDNRYDELRQLSTGDGGRGGLNLAIINALPVPLPPLPEQRKIATILSTWDEAITKTQQLIAQLQQRNKGLMQQLLTGKKRLNGFEEAIWEKLQANEIFRSVSMKNNPGEQLLSATQDRGIIPRSMLEARVTMPAGQTASFKLVEKGDFVISLRSFQGGIEYSEYRGLVSPAYTVLKPSRKINDSYYKHYFKSYDFIGHLAVAVIGIRDGKQVSYEDFSFLKLPYPSVKEQEAIATVLDAAVNELKLYEQKLASLQHQKKGMMQKLLTGEVRVKIDN